MKLATLAGLALASMSLCACAGMSLPLTGNPTADAKTAAQNFSVINSNLGAFNQQAMNQIIQHCAIKGTLNVAIPNPVPTGNLAINCDIEPGGLTAPPGATTLGLSPAAIGTPAPAK